MNAFCVAGSFLDFVYRDITRMKNPCLRYLQWKEAGNKYRELEVTENGYKGERAVKRWWITAFIGGFTTDVSKQRRSYQSSSLTEDDAGQAQL